MSDTFIRLSFRSFAGTLVLAAALVGCGTTAETPDSGGIVLPDSGNGALDLGNQPDTGRPPGNDAGPAMGPMDWATVAGLTPRCSAATRACLVACPASGAAAQTCQMNCFAADTTPPFVQGSDMIACSDCVDNQGLFCQFAAGCGDALNGLVACSQAAGCTNANLVMCAQMNCPTQVQAYAGCIQSPAGRACLTFTQPNVAACFAPATDAGTPTTDAGTPAADTGTPATDSGTTPDAGTTADTGTAAADAGAADAGPDLGPN